MLNSVSFPVFIIILLFSFDDSLIATKNSRAEFLLKIMLLLLLLVLSCIVGVVVASIIIAVVLLILILLHDRDR